VDQHWKKSPSESYGGVVVKTFALCGTDAKQCVNLHLMKKTIIYNK